MKLLWIFTTRVITYFNVNWAQWFANLYSFPSIFAISSHFSFWWNNYLCLVWMLTIGCVIFFIAVCSLRLNTSAVLLWKQKYEQASQNWNCPSCMCSLCNRDIEHRLQHIYDKCPLIKQSWICWAHYPINTVVRRTKKGKKNMKMRPCCCLPNGTGTARKPYTRLHLSSYCMYFIITISKSGSNKIGESG